MRASSSVSIGKNTLKKLEDLRRSTVSKTSVKEPHPKFRSECVVYWFVPRDFRYLRGIKDVMFFKHGNYWKISASCRGFSADCLASVPDSQFLEPRTLFPQALTIIFKGKCKITSIDKTPVTKRKVETKCRYQHSAFAEQWKMNTTNISRQPKNNLSRNKKKSNKCMWNPRDWRTEKIFE